MSLIEYNEDYVQRFVFDDLDARGCIVRLETTCEEIQATHHYTKELGYLLNQFAVAAVLLRDSLKVQADITIQLRTPDAISLLMADCQSDYKVRAICEYEQSKIVSGKPVRFDEFSKGSTLTITITPKEGERYQGIVPIEQASFTKCLEDYFARSEQLPTWFNFFANSDIALGIAIHALPSEKVKDSEQTQEYFERLQMLLNTLSEEEALSLSANEILTRLFHEESCRLFDAKPVKFGCVCSAQKSLDAIKSLGEQEVAELVEEQKEQGASTVVVDCHFCFQRYEFEFDQIKALF
jgi:molecular chaperone Hsp33